jgi:hypothetical protein
VECRLCRFYRTDANPGSAARDDRECRSSHAPLSLDALDAYLHERVERLTETPDPEPATGSWRSLVINLTRAAADENVQAGIRWDKTARRLIKEFDLQA